jgi:predicted short-subunit dehydrogenase-like oxidoreductase (DUF2520 family)
VTPPTPGVAILGAGRAGSAIYARLREIGEAPALLWTRSEVTAQAARADGFPAESGATWPDFRSASLVLLAVSDGAVGGVAQSLAGSIRPDAVVAHLSGALDLTPLAPFSAEGIAVGSLHPLVSIAQRRTSLAGAVAAVASSAPSADERLSELARKLGMSVIRPIGDRARYHAAASIVGNFPQVLLEGASQLLRSLGITEQESQRALGLLLQGAARNAAELGPAAGLTGPIVRGDVEVVQRHLNALSDNGEVRDLYVAAGRIAVELARHRGSPRIDDLKALFAGE